MSSELIKHISDESFEWDVLRSELPVLVDFWAPWCGPCKMMDPILDEIAEAYKGKLTVAKLNVDENPEIPASQGVRNIPTMTLFKNGAVAATKSGTFRKAELETFLNNAL
ncbi:thioredoxin TrxA [Pseudomonas baetica]|uniref:thioredoxin TrxA n=1 Tax=Pseudomonas baetica TaxID=674054 RepID=UPI001C8B567E|nr:thioredoxin TrxA [Pseudomonas baetica]MBX9408080.1 thioredoxin TrxA [Pseudomonas baetica]